MKKAILYSAHGKKYIEESFKSAEYAKKFITNETLILHTSNTSSHKELNRSPFDIIIKEEMDDIFLNKIYAFRIQSMINACKNLDFDQFLYLDTDACVMRSEGLEIFDLLDQYDIAVSHAPVRHAFFYSQKYQQIYDHPNTLQPSIPMCFPEFNTGVILFNKKCLSLFEKWQQLYLSDIIKHPNDQGSFRFAMYFSQLMTATLTPEYNDRSGQIKNCYIYHGPRSVG